MGGFQKNLGGGKKKLGRVRGPMRGLELIM